MTYLAGMTGFLDWSADTTREVISNLRYMVEHEITDNSIGICGNLHRCEIEGVTICDIIGLVGHYQGCWRHSTLNPAYPVPRVNAVEGKWTGEHLVLRRNFVNHLIECLERSIER
tara:strand:- start:6196 stop:6540 length:345 start_codon:yes stop_codon:yes gene_type:complete